MGCDVTIGRLRGALNAASSALEGVASVTFDSPRQRARILSDMRPVLLLCLAHMDTMSAYVRDLFRKAIATSMCDENLWNDRPFVTLL